MAAAVPYKVTAKLNVPEWLPVQVNAWPFKPVPVPVDNADSSLLIGVEYAGPRVTVLDVEWTTHLPYDPALAREWDAKRLGFIVLPPTRPGDMPIMHDIACDLVWAVYPAVVRLTAATGKSAFLAAFLEAPYRELVASARAQVDGLDLDVKPMAVKTTGPKAQKRWLDSQSLGATLARSTHRYEHFLAQADLHRDRRDLGTTVAWLATTLEVAAYECVGAALPGKDFSPRLFLGSGYPAPKRGSLLEVDPASYAACHELWGTRHEVLHNGRLQVRTYDPTTERADRNKLRPLVADDLAAFRRAIDAATTWLETER